MAPALPAIQTDLHASTTGATWILTAYLLSACVATPIVGRLGDMFGKKKMLVVTPCGARAGSRRPGGAGVDDPLMVARVIQGIGGAVFPLAFAFIRDEFPRGADRQRIALDIGPDRHGQRVRHLAVPAR